MTESTADAVTTLDILQALHNYQQAFDASTGWAQIRLVTPWRNLCNTYSQSVADNVYAREAASGHLVYAACACPGKCSPCFINGTPVRLTDKGMALLRSRAAEG
ncbi:hypothetical protein ACFW9I_03245 [[Kitasatospora] papulosa]|uniref:hypothetical protein n=1 Tax=[Kitasatospora] papulosa TaxID=1464011 RepID=UPI0036B75FF2